MNINESVVAHHLREIVIGRSARRKRVSVQAKSLGVTQPLNANK
jgi:hypothetical protein